MGEAHGRMPAQGPATNKHVMSGQSLALRVDVPLVRGTPSRRWLSSESAGQGTAQPFGGRLLIGPVRTGSLVDGGPLGHAQRCSRAAGAPCGTSDLSLLA